MKRIFHCEAKGNENGIIQFISLLLFLLPIYRAQNTLECTEMIRNNKCSCYTFEDGKSNFNFNHLTVLNTNYVYSYLFYSYLS